MAFRLSVIVAMDSELRAAEQLLGGSSRGLLGGCEVSLHKSGIGKVNAALTACRIIGQEQPDAVLSTGVCGGIDSCLQVTDVLVGSATCYHDVWCGEGNAKGQVQGLPARYVGDTRLLQVATAMGLRTGLICTGDQFITDRVALDAIKADFPDGMGVDMESAAIAQTCYLMQVPFMALRIVSDTPGNTPDHTAQYKDFWATMSEKSFRVLKEFLERLGQCATTL